MFSDSLRVNIELLSTFGLENFDTSIPILFMTNLAKTSIEEQHFLVSIARQRRAVLIWQLCLSVRPSYCEEKKISTGRLLHASGFLQGGGGLWWDRPIRIGFAQSYSQECALPSDLLVSNILPADTDLILSSFVPADILRSRYNDP